MSFINRKHITGFLLVMIIILGAFLRFYKLDWGQGLFTHPDEYHIAASVNQLSFPIQMHPHFFSYGTVTIYLIYFTQEIIKYLSSISHFPFSIFNSFLLGRFYSALFSTLTIFIVYKICRAFMQKHLSYLAALLVALTPGLIQQAHFATPESALTFFLFLSLLLIIKFLKNNKAFYLIFASIALGFAMGVKISSMVFLLPLLLSIVLSAYFKRHSGLSRISNHLGDSGCAAPRTVWCRAAAYQNDVEDFRSFRKPLRLTILILASLIVTIITFAIVAPFVFLDFPAFGSNLQYEGGLALGKIPVFYTRQFIDTIPVLFQTEKILPYALGPVLLTFSILGLIFLILRIIKIYRHLGWWQAERTRSHDSSEVDVHGEIMVLIFIAFLSLFLPNAFLFAKWTRFIAPTFPFFAIFAAFLLQSLTQRMKTLAYTLEILLIVSSSLWAMAFFSIYTSRDVRITASEWLESHVKPASSFLVEGGNTVDLPLTGNFPRTSLHFYALEDDPITREKIIDALHSSDYFLVQSRRVFMNHQRLRHLYPRTAQFYDTLFDGRLGFEQIKEFHSYPKLTVGSWKLGVTDEAAEETWSVFDHPVIRVFKKSKQLSKQEYAKFLEN